MIILFCFTSQHKTFQELSFHILALNSQTLWLVKVTSHLQQMASNRLLSAEIATSFISVHAHCVNTYMWSYGICMSSHSALGMRFRMEWTCRGCARYSVGQEWCGMAWSVPSLGLSTGPVYTLDVGTRSPTRPPVGSPLPVFSRIWFTKSEVSPATGDFTAERNVYSVLVI